MLGISQRNIWDAGYRDIIENCIANARASTVLAISDMLGYIGIHIVYYPLSFREGSISLGTNSSGQVWRGHRPFSRHVERLGIPTNDFCRSCGLEKETVSCLL